MTVIKKLDQYKNKFHSNSTDRSRNDQKKVIHLFQLFRFANRIDWFYMTLGTIGSVGHGASSPLLWLMFGYITNSFTKIDFDLCTINFEYLSQMFCPANIYLTSRNFRREYRKCNYTAFNITIPEEGHFFNDIQLYSISIALIGLGALICAYLQTACWGMSGERQTRRIRLETFRSIIQDKDVSYFDTHSPGELTTLLSEGINKVNDGIGEKVGCTFQYSSSCLTGLIIGFVTGWKLTLVILSMSPFLALSGILFSKIGARMASEEQEIYGKAGQLAEQVLSSIKTVFAYNATEHELNRYANQIKITRKNGIKMGSLFGLVTGFDYLVVFCADALGFWYGAKLIREENYTIGQTLMVFFTVISALFALGRSAPYIQAIISAKGSAFFIWNLIDTKKTEDRQMKLKPSKIDGNIAFVNVKFAYPSRPTSIILNNISFNISAGQTIAIVGSTGSGKSTCIELIERFYEPLSGFILLDGEYLNKYDIQWLRKSIGVVNQQPILFETTVMENIRMGDENATDEQIIELCQNLQIHQTIIKLSNDGYQTKISQNGSNLSGGQRQKIALARALLKNPQILILDEATAALDNESERQLQIAIEKASQNRTTIIIAHRLSTIRHADQIIVLDQGNVEENGTHQSLMEQKGKYSQLIQTQLIDENISEEQQVLQSFVSIPMDSLKTLDEEENDQKRINWIFFKILRLNKPEWIFILGGCLTALINGGIEPAFAFLLSRLVAVLEECDQSRQTQNINFYIILFVVSGIVMLITMFLQSFFFSWSGEGLTRRLRLRAYRTILQQNISWFDRSENSPGILCAKLSTETSAIHETNSVLLGLFLRSLANLSIGLILGFYASWKLTLLMCGFIPLIILSGWLQTKVLSKFVKRDSRALEKAANIVAQVTQNIRTVFLLTEEEHFLQKYKEILDEPYRKVKYRSHLNGLLFGLANSLSFFAQSALFSFGSYLVQQNQIYFEDIILIFSVVMFGCVSVSQSFAMAPNYAKARSAAKKLFQLFHFEQKESLSIQSDDEKDSFTGIQFENVAFAYESRPDKIVLKNFSLKIEPGQHIAFIGASGCGKSTAIQLLEGFYDYSQGSIKFNSKELRHLNMKNIRSQMAFVSQDAVLFDMSIGENIKYGDLTREISDEEMINAAQRANIHDFILKLPQGYSTMIGSKGFQLSGGERQRIAIARALIRRAQILLFDEPTSALDVANEEIVQKCLDEVQRNCTSITIAHRLTTVKNADRIYLIDRGRIIESGNHQELIQLKGHYYKLIQISQS